MPSIAKVSAKGGGSKDTKTSEKGGKGKQTTTATKVTAKEEKAATNGAAAVPSAVPSSAASETGSGGGGGRQSPSADGAPECNAPALEVTPVGEVLVMLEKKVRNLDKRKVKQKLSQKYKIFHTFYLNY